jgi:prepilin-type N-terminal cleavage/methylation domain-containing protein
MVEMNKKGFTLVELLAVIAILAILVIMAVPNVINLFNEAKASTFVSQAQSLYKSVEQQVVANQMKNASSGSYVFCSGDSASSISLSGSSNVHYYVTYSAGKVTSFFVEDGSYVLYLDATTANNDVKLSDLSASSNGTYSNVYLLASGKSISTCAAPSADIKGTAVSVE